ncbi:MAG: VCBS repeat-containing protein [Planctomycetota bacterium]
MRTPSSLWMMLIVVIGGLAAWATGQEEPVSPQAVTDDEAVASTVPDAAPEAAPASLPEALPQYDWSDLDGDGTQEAIVQGPYGGQRVYRYLGGSTFEDVTNLWQLRVLADAQGALWEDFDGDGRTDALVVTRDGTARLMKNAGESFQDVTLETGLEGIEDVRSVKTLPVDEDGQVDLQIETKDGTKAFKGSSSGRFESIPLPQPKEGDFPAPQPGAGPSSRGSRLAGRVGAGFLEIPSNTFGGGTGPTPNPSGPPGQPPGPAGSTPACVSAIEDVSGGACLQASSVPTLGLLHPLSDDFFIDSSGRIGIGTTSPAQDVEVQDGQAVVRLSTTGSSSGSVIELRNTAAAPTFWGAINFTKNNHSVAGQLGVRGDGAMTFRAGTGATERLRADDSGILVTGSTSMTEDLFVQGDGQVDGKLAVGPAFGNELNLLNLLPLPGSNGSTNGISFVSSSFPTLTTMSLGLDYSPSGIERDRLSFYDSNNSSILTAENRGYLGIGTSSPDHRLEIINRSSGVGASVLHLEQDTADPILTAESPGSPDSNFRIENDGRIYARSSTGSGIPTSTVYAENSSTGMGIGLTARTYGTDATVVFDQRGSGDIARGFTGGSLVFRVLNTGRVVTTALQITGGGDLVEGFETGEQECEPGSVLVIDPDRPGELMLSDSAYDAKVAGVVSGANGVNHGIRMGQDDVLDGDTLVAMTGRVYVKCTTENGAIRPGDRLTTSSLAGHAMKATDAARTDGAVIGKAMSSLDEETGLVLVLVNLQ